MTNHKIVSWRDESDLSKGFTIDLENISAAELFASIYQRPEELISAFADCFLMMRYSPDEASEMSHELYEQTRSQLDTMIDRLRSKTYVPLPANMDTH
ncbi:hypothetical protein [Pantoea sp. Marseille-Q5743]|uniref:hypothetical protein n=1 Tax=Pantoea sp. Marseille-Q5743 TaxID=2972776 RepID=UPI0021C76D1D|nr:hypothetical protein [Pantoea sp. Marseille-Q5743]